MSWTWLIEVCGWEKILLEGPQANAPCTYPVVMLTVAWGAMDLAILSPVFDFVFSLS